MLKNSKKYYFDFKIFIYSIIKKNNMKKDNMKNKYDSNKRKKLSITIEPQIVRIIDEQTTNRSSIINWILKDYFNKMGENVSKIKL